MKNFQTTLLAGTFMFVTYIAAPPTAHAGGWQCQAQWLEAQQAQKNVDRSVDVAFTVAAKGKPCIDEVDALDVDVATETFVFSVFPNQCLIQDLLDSEIADLQLRAQNFIAHEKDVIKTQYEIVLARYERAVIELTEAWKSGEMAEDIAEKALFTLRIDAFHYLESLGLTSIRARLQEAISVLTERGKNAMDQIDAQHEFYVKLYTIRLEAALAVLQDRVTAGKASKYDFHMVAKLVAALERLQNSTTPYNCGT
ncbi:MAG: hypothetical protein JNL28_01565 [Planctomycetes bacterium]|nr:hypothetical protein [Planctomycetota bacterium]